MKTFLCLILLLTFGRVYAQPDSDPVEVEAPTRESAARARLIEAMRNRSTPRVVSNPGAPGAPQAVATPVPPGPPAVAPAIPVPPPSSPFAVAQPATAASAPAPSPTQLIKPSYRSAALDIVLQEYSQRTGKVILRDPKVGNITVTLESRDPLTVDEFLRAVDALLAMNNIAIVPFRDNFLKVVPADSVVRSGIDLNLTPAEALEEEDSVISQVVELKYLDYTEVQTLITERLSPNAKVQPLERTNGMLITDSRNNVRRIQEILTLIDRPAEVREEVKIYPILHATAGDIKSRLEELIADSQEALNQQTARTPAVTRSVVRTPPGVIRPGTTTAATPASGGDEPVSPGLIRGKVQIVADERTNILIIISRPENDSFFEDMIATLDKKVDPEIIVRVYALEFADAEEVSSTLNDLIGAASQNEGPETVNSANTNSENSRTGQSIQDFIRQRNATRESTATNDNPNRSASNIGEISENTKILADKRTNSLILMGRSGDLDNLNGVIRQLDIMLAQVLVRAVIMEVNLNENFSYGIDWLQSAMTVNNKETVNGVPIRNPVLAFGGGQNLSSASTEFRDAGTVDRGISLVPGSLSYFTTFYDLNLDAVIRLAQGNSDTKVIATPVILTTDNTEATIVVGERRAIPTTTATTIGGSIQSSFEYENIGLDLTVTPRINPQKVVVMEIDQSAENVGGTTRIDGNDVPIITTRQLSAQVAIQSGSTLVLGGLVREDLRETESKVPLLGDIPFLGALFRSQSKETVRTELLVLISPQVVMSAEEAHLLTEQLKASTELGKDSSWHRGWDKMEPDLDNPSLPGK